MHYHKRITDKQWEDAKKIDLKANLVNRTPEETYENIDTIKILSIIHTLTL